LDLLEIQKIIQTIAYKKICITFLYQTKALREPTIVVTANKIFGAVQIAVLVSDASVVPVVPVVSV
jgi:hypothetical protein